MSTITDAAHRALRLTATLIDRHGPRLTGREATLAAADELREEIGRFADRAWVQDFPVRPGAFLGWIRLLVSFFVIAVVLLWFRLELAAALLVTLGIVIMVLEFFLYREPIDFLWPRRIGRNVLGVVEPSGDVRRQLIVSGHHDSAHIFNFFVHQPQLYPLRVFGGIGSIALLFLWSWVMVALGTAGADLATVAPWGAGVFTAALTLVLQLWFFASPKGTPGAGDNLVSTAAAIEIGRHFANAKSQGKGLEHTRVIVASWDAEEAGLRGARAYARAWRDALSSIPSVNYNMDCPYQLQDLFFLTSDINGSVRLDSALAARCRRIAGEMGHEAEVKDIAFLTGGTDAAELAKAGVAATTLMAMPWGNDERAAAYHTPGDTVETIEPAAVEAAIGIGIRLAEELDRESN